MSASEPREPLTEGPIVPTPHATRPVRWGRWVSVALLVLAVAAVAGHWLWGRREARRLEAQLAVYRAAGEPVTVDELNRWPDATSGSGDNAVPILRAAGEGVEELGPTYKKYMEAESLLPLTDAEVAAYEAVVKENEKAIRAVDEARTKSRVDWGLAFQSPMFADLAKSQGLNELRKLCNLLQADGMLSHRAGDDARALKRVDQILFASRVCGHQPTLIGYLVSLGMSWQASTLAAEIMPDLSVAKPAEREAVKSIINQLLDERHVDAARRRGFLGERVLQLDAVTALTERRVQADTAGIARLNAMGWLMRPVFLEDAQVMAAYMTDMVRATAASPDWPAYQAKAPRSPKSTGDGFTPHMLVQIMLPGLDRAVMTYYRALTERRLAATCLAARLYAADHDGRFPDSLDELVPDYLPSVPADPFAAGGKRLGYVNEAADAKDPRVYGVGENGTDNGGVEIDPYAPRAQTDKLKDEIRHFRRQPRPKPPDFSRAFPGAPPGMYPLGFPGAPFPPQDEDWDLEEGDAATAEPAPPEAGAETPPVQRGDNP